MPQDNFIYKIIAASTLLLWASQTALAAEFPQSSLQPRASSSHNTNAPTPLPPPNGGPKLSPPMGAPAQRAAAGGKVGGGTTGPAVSVPGVSPFATGDEDETNDLEVQRRTVRGSTATRNTGAINGTPTSISGGATNSSVHTNGAVGVQHPRDIKNQAVPNAMQAKQPSIGTPAADSSIPVHK